MGNKNASYNDCLKRTSPRPTTLLEMGGSDPQHTERSYDKHLPIPLLRHVDPPEHLSPIAAELWQDVVGELGRVGLIASTDLTGLEMLCECYADWCRARQVLAQRESDYYSIVDANGNTRWVVHPAVGVAQQADTRLRSWLGEFGMTPLARARWRGPSTEHREQPPSVDLSELSEEERDQLRQVIENKLSGDAQEAA